MKGSVRPHARGYWVIDWYHNGKHERFYSDFLHGGGKFWMRHHDKAKCIGYEMASRCLNQMRTDWEAYCRGERAFDINKYRGSYTDVIPYLQTWLKTKEGKVMPGTFKLYSGSISKHLIPFFERHPVQLHEIQKDTIDLLVSELTCAPKDEFWLRMPQAEVPLKKGDLVSVLKWRLIGELVSDPYKFLGEICVDVELETGTVLDELPISSVYPLADSGIFEDHEIFLPLDQFDDTCGCVHCQPHGIDVDAV